MNITDFVIGYEEFKIRYLAASTNVESATDFWNTYNQDPIGLLNNRQFLLLRDRLFHLLIACRNINADAFINIHKGHPYYFIGISSYLLDDYQTAIYYLDAAVTEDMNSGADPMNSPRPSTRFLMLEGETTDQAARPITKIAQAKVERVLRYYHNSVNKDSVITELTIEDLRNYFICYSLRKINGEPGLRTLVTSFITFCTEWDFRKDHFESGVSKGTAEPFYLHLFRGCILFESLLKHNPKVKPSKDTLVKILKEQKIIDELKITAITGGSYTLNDVFNELKQYDNSIYSAIKITCMARNTLGHTLGWNENITQSQYHDLYYIIASSCLHILACLWRTA